MEANSELMLVLQHAGQPLESSSSLETLDPPARCEIINQLLSAVPRLLFQRETAVGRDAVIRQY